MHPDRRKGPGEAEALADRMRSVHADSLLPSTTANTYATKPFRYFVVAMSVALIATTVLGIVLAFRFSRQKWIVWLSLLLGLLLPIGLLWFGQRP